MVVMAVIVVVLVVIMVEVVVGMMEKEEVVVEVVLVLGRSSSSCSFCSSEISSLVVLVCGGGDRGDCCHCEGVWRRLWWHGLVHEIKKVEEAVRCAEAHSLTHHSLLGTRRITSRISPGTDLASRRRSCWGLRTACLSLSTLMAAMGAL